MKRFNALGWFLDKYIYIALVLTLITGGVAATAYNDGTQVTRTARKPPAQNLASHTRTLLPIYWSGAQTCCMLHAECCFPQCGVMSCAHAGVLHTASCRARACLTRPVLFSIQARSSTCRPTATLARPRTSRARCCFECIIQRGAEALHRPAAGSRGERPGPIDRECTLVKLSRLDQSAGPIRLHRPELQPRVA